MIDLKRILLPTDFSEFSQAAVAYGCALAEKFDSELHLLNVVQDLVELIPEAGMAFPPPGVYIEELRHSSKASLEKVLDPAWVEKHKVVRVVRDGVPFLEILRYAQEADVDLIVLGTHGRTGLSHVLMGSVAERIVRKASCPVLTVRPAGHQFVHP
jgi:nucleotide-binding universal stress UspA family protein